MEPLSIFSSMRWQDVVDIVLNSYILFRLYVLLRGTRALFVVAGIGLLLLVQYVAFNQGLIVTSWVFQGLATVSALIIIVVFRNDIQTILRTTNLRDLLWGIPRPITLAPVDSIVDAVFEMSEKRIGSLIVIPGKNDISEYVKNGITWKGVISKEMLISIFWHGNPVHDGAAVISGDRVREVGAILPLTERNDLPSYYGTRHRAALGLTERSEAMALVVSEERGTVTMAKSGFIRPVYKRDELSRLLQEHAGGKKKGAKQQFQEYIRLGIAAFMSLLLITGVWFNFTRGMDTMITFETAMEFVNQKPGMQIVDSSDHSIRLLLNGAEALINSIRPEQVRVRLDLTQAEIGKNSFFITENMITVPPGISIKGVNPQVVEITFDMMTKKELPVQIEWTGILPRSFLLEYAETNPSKITVTGRSMVLDEIKTIYTEKIPLTELRFGKGRIKTKPALNTASVRLVPGESDQIIIEYYVKEKILFRD